jgi:hypothetical protein
MRIRVELSALRRTQWHEYLIRFLLGGAITVIAGLIAKGFGPVIGGLFLAFPAIFPASATLIDKHELKKKRKAGIPVTLRGRLAVALDARGAALGAIALAGFAWFVWRELPGHETPWVLGAGVLLWFIAAVLIWRARKLHVYLSRHRRKTSA